MGVEQLAEWAGSALEAGDGAALQPLTQRVDALGGEDATDSAVAVSDKAAQRIVAETVERVQDVMGL